MFAQAISRTKSDDGHQGLEGSFVSTSQRGSTCSRRFDRKRIGQVVGCDPFLVGHCRGTNLRLQSAQLSRQLMIVDRVCGGA